MFWRTLLTTTSTSHVVREGEFEKDKQAFNYIILLNQGKCNKVFHKVENGALVSLSRDLSVPSDEKILSGSSSLKNSASQSVSLQTLLLVGEPMPLGQHWELESS